MNNGIIGSVVVAMMLTIGGCATAPEQCYLESTARSDAEDGVCTTVIYSTQVSTAVPVRGSWVVSSSGT